MKTITKVRNARMMALGALVGTGLMASLPISTSVADETCMSPYMAKITGQEDFDPAHQKWTVR